MNSPLSSACRTFISVIELLSKAGYHCGSLILTVWTFSLLLELRMHLHAILNTLQEKIQGTPGLPWTWLIRCCPRQISVNSVWRCVTILGKYFIKVPFVKTSCETLRLTRKKNVKKHFQSQTSSARCPFVSTKVGGG